MRIYRWDLDKTYLDTDFHSVRGIVRAATEPAENKRTIPGASALLRALSNRENSHVAILSGSPTQMRKVLSEKLRLDGVRFDELQLKDNLGNLSRGRFRAIREQMGFKLPALLDGRVGLGVGVPEVLFGDDSEADALVYSVFADVLAGRIEPRRLGQIMEAAGAYSDAIHRAQRTSRRLHIGEVVERIFIHLDRGLPPRRFTPFGTRLVPVHAWLQAAAVLHTDGRLSGEEVLTVAQEMLDEGTPVNGLANLFQDIVRRGFARREDIEGIWSEGTELEPLRIATLKRMARMGKRKLFQPSAPPEAPDYLALVRDFRNRSKRQKKA
jgi:hypothetical protein